MMKHVTHRIGLMLLLLTCLPVWMLAQAPIGNDSESKAPTATFLRQYTSEKPLVFEDAWDIWPYAYHSDTGEDMGFNIDLLQIVMEELGIPYIVKLKPRKEVVEDLRTGRADLTLGMDAVFHNLPVHYGKSVIQLFTHSVAWHKGEPQPFSKESDLENEQVIVHEGSYCQRLMVDKGWDDHAVTSNHMKEELMNIDQGGKGHILWNTASLRWLRRTYHMENIDIAPVVMSDGEYKFMSSDTTLLNLIDEAYNKLNADDRIEPLRNYWFYPDEKRLTFPSWVWHILNGAVVAVVLFIGFVFMLRRREQKAIEQGRLRTSRLALIMRASGLSIWLYDVTDKEFIWLDKDGIARNRYKAVDFTKRIAGSNYGVIMEGLRQLEEGEKNSKVIEVTTYAESNPTGGDHIYVITLSVLRYDKGKPKMIIAVCDDVTATRERMQQTQERLLRYRSIFNNAMVDMVYYDEEGYIVDMNERIQHSFQMDLQETLKERVSIRHAADDINFDFEHIEQYNVVRFLNSHGENDNVKSRKVKDAITYELQLVPVHDKKGKLLGIYGTGLDISETVKTYQQVKESVKKVQLANKEATDYVQNINYVMGVSGVRLADYSPEKHLLTIYRGLEVVQQRLTQSRCMRLADERSKKVAMRTLNAMDSLNTAPIDIEIKTTLHVGGAPLYLNFQFIPTFNEDGSVNGYFGMCRDISEIKKTEQLLEQETARAQEVENLKNSFLHNMSHEIRTPLNTVVGFAELFEQDHATDDEAVFIQEIKSNSAHLLQLINDILFLSRLDAHMIEINKQPTDFAITFEGYCQLGWANHQKEGVRYIAENRYDQLIVDIDDANIGRVIEQITTNAATHTERGYVRARYDYMGDRLIIVIEDSGSGMSPQMLSQIYKRFSSNGNGTGLGIPICKELVEQMGGTIEINSREGDGTTVWITIPCQATAIDRKKDI